MRRRKEPRIPDAALDQLLAGADPKTAFDPNGLIDDLKKALAERVLNAEMDHHLAGLGKPETFDFPGLTHICGRSRRSRFLLFRRTRRDRKRANVREVKDELRRRMHDPIPSQDSGCGRW